MFSRNNVIQFVSAITRWSIFSVVFFVPIYFAWFQENYTIFDLNKSVALHSLLAIGIISWLIQISLEGKFQWQGNKKFFILGTSVTVVFLLSTIFSRINTHVVLIQKKFLYLRTLFLSVILSAVASEEPYYYHRH